MESLKYLTGLISSLEQQLSEINKIMDDDNVIGINFDSLDVGNSEGHFSMRCLPKQFQINQSHPDFQEIKTKILTIRAKELCVRIAELKNELALIFEIFQK